MLLQPFWHNPDYMSVESGDYRTITSDLGIIRLMQAEHSLSSSEGLLDKNPCDCLRKEWELDLNRTE